MSKKRKLTQQMDPEVLMITEHMQMIAGDNKLLETIPLMVVIEGRNTFSYVEVSAISEKALEAVIADMSEKLFQKCSRLVTRQRDRLLVSAPQI